MFSILSICWKQCQFLNFLDRETGEVFLEICPGNKVILYCSPFLSQIFKFSQRDAKTLETIIKKRVRPGTHILTDCWVAYSKLEKLEGL